MIAKGLKNFGYVVVCEKCGCLHNHCSPSIAIATNRAAASGWRRKHGRVYCPICYQIIERDYKRIEL